MAKIFAREGFSLVLVARHEDRLREVANDFLASGTETKIIAADLSDKHSPAEIFAQLQSGNIFISVLVNNAGFGRQKAFAKTSLPEQLEMIEVNVASLVHLTHLFVQPMLARRDGRILNIASTASFQPGPFMSIYYASKAFVFSFSYALADELEGSGVSVTTLCPGPTESRFHERAGRIHSEKALRLWMMTAGDVAEAGYRGLMAGTRVVIPGLLNKLGYFFAKIFPVRVPTKVARRIISRGNPVD